MVYALRTYFEMEREHGGPLIDVNKVVERTAAALKISRHTVMKITKEKDKVMEVEEEDGLSHSLLETPGKKRHYEKRVTKLDAFQKDAFRRHVYSYYERKEHPTLKKLHSSLQEASIFDGSESSLRTCLVDLGFEYAKFSNREILMERQDIVSWRCRYLRATSKVAYENIIWLDETWVNAGHTLARGWTDRTAGGTMKAPLGKGGRIIVLHAGCCKGFVPNCLLMFRSKKTGDYHEEMNSRTFKEWFLNSLLNNIPPNSTIVMDNAPYHSVIINKAPIRKWRKADIMTWVQTNVVQKFGVEIEPGIKKDELLELADLYKPRFPTYEIDELARKSGHNILRLPPYHAHLNPIENIWAQVKGYVARNNKKFTITEVERLTREGIEQVTPADWANVVRSTKSITEKAWEEEGILETRVENLVISLSASSSSSSSSCSSSSSDDEDLSLGVAPLSP